MKIRLAGRKLAKMARKRKRQADKKQSATMYRPGDQVWIKLHRRSNATRGITKKMNLLYEGPYRVQSEIRPNAFLFEDEEENMLGMFNSRQLRPHRTAKMFMQPEDEVTEEIAEICVLEIQNYERDTNGSNGNTAVYEEDTNGASGNKTV